MSVHRIKNLDIWPSLRALLEHHRDILLGPNKRIIIQDYGRVVIVYDVATFQLTWVRQGTNRIEQPVVIEQLSNRPLYWIGWSEHAIFALTGDTRNLLCWDPHLNCNTMIDPNNDVELNRHSYVRSKVHKVAFGSLHVLMLCDDELESPSKQMVAVYSWSEFNLLGNSLTYLPTHLEIYFQCPILDLACTRNDGSIVLDEQNTVHLWGTFNGKMHQYVNSKFTFNFGNEIKMKRVYASSKNIIFLDQEGVIYHMNYEKEYFISPRMLPTEEFIEEVFANNTSPVAILLGINGRMYVWDSNKVFGLIMQFIPDAYCLNVHQSTPEPVTITFDEESFRQLQIKLSSFNNILDNCFSFLINNRYGVSVHRHTLFERMQQESALFHQMYHLHGYDKYYIETLCHFLDQFSTPVSYAFLYYLHTGEVNTDEPFLDEMKEMARQGQCFNMIKAIEQKIRDNELDLIRRKQEIALMNKHHHLR